MSDDTAVNISITWDSGFNLVHNVSSYRVVANEGSAASCPSSCDPSGPCKCTGLEIGEDTNITISAINCGNQMGPPVEITARPQGNHTKGEHDKHVTTVLHAYSSIQALRVQCSTYLYFSSRSSYS